ncbi:O-antigen ligase family protein [Robertmurraya andreesenii]|uniref:O-antigen ligase-related domain-containing protein n=1 Tax=Anoxybacillus andreesenii TaxID=1325932 RepID=A0ABT9V341_9BACL|nr:O-antigen ligase family protein [Robertmurraya andreesenii]MDQ0155368.1 hypothetical protein [Robertmurraya andreesenii]
MTKSEISILNKNVSFNPVDKINKIVCIFLCAFVCWPYLSSKVGLLLFILLFGTWLLTTDYKCFVDHLTVDIIMIGCWLVTFFPYIITGNFFYGAYSPRAALLLFFLFICGILITHYYMYYKKDFQMLGKIALFSLSFYAIASLQTYLGLKKYPLASRMLAVGDETIKQNYHGLGIGGFGFVYSSVFIIIPLIYFFSKKTSTNNVWHKVISIIVFVMMLLMLFRASYTIALLFTLVGIFLVFFIRGKKSLIVGVLFAVLFLIFIPGDLIGSFFIHMANLFQENDTIRVKFLDFAQGFLTESTGAQTSYRVQLYLSSFQTFLDNPLFGIYGPFGNQMNAVIGGHSGWLDLMAYYGLFGSLPLFIGIYLILRRQLLFYFNHPYFIYLLIVNILFIVFGFINPTITIYEIGFSIFVIVPTLPFLPYAFLKK